MQDEKKWEDETRTEKKWGDKMRDQKKNGEIICKIKKKMGR